MQVSRPIKWLLLILLLGMILRLAWVYYVNTQPVSDFKHYNDLALSLLHGGGYNMPEGLDYIKQSTPFIQQGVHYPSAFRPPGYPFFLVALYLLHPSILTAKIGNALLGAAWICCAFLLGRKYWSDRAGLWAAGMTAVFPPAIAYTSVLGTEILAATLLLSILCLYAYQVGGRWNPLLVGAFMGLLSLVKPEFIVLPVLYALLLWWQTGGRQATDAAGPAGAPGEGRQQMFVRERLLVCVRGALLAALALAIVISPWTVRNYLVFHRFVPISTNGDLVLYINNNDLNRGMYMDPMLVPGSIFKTGRILDSQGVYNEADAMKLAGQEAERWILGNPRQFFMLGLDRLSVSYLYAGSEIEEWTMTATHAEVRFDKIWVPPLLQIAQGAALVAVGGGSLYCLLLLFSFFDRRPLNDLHKINLLFILFLTAVIFASEGQPRDVFTVYPFFILGIAWMAERLSRALDE